MTAWHEQDDFWETMPMFSREHMEVAPEEVDQIVFLLGLRPGAAVLDMCCGIGRHSIEFAHRGYSVTGVDRTVAYLTRASETAAAQDLHVEWIHADAREFMRAEAFDLAINLYTSFGYFEDPAENKRMAENILHSLKPSGFLVMDLMGKERLARIFTPRDWRELPDGSLFLQERTIKDDWNWIENRWILVRDGQRRDFTLGHHLYDGAGLRALLLDAGFESVALYGDLGGAPYDNDARRLVAVACKAGSTPGG